MTGKTFNLSLPEELVKKADSAAKKNYQNRTDIIKEALMQYLGLGTRTSGGRQIHGLAADAREKGETLKALSLYHQALAAYQSEGDDLGFAEALADESISLRHMYESTGDKNWLILAKHNNMAGAEIAEKSGDKEAMALPLFQLANVQDELGEYKEAVSSYQLAINSLKVKNRTAMLADFEMHLCAAEFHAGDKEAVKRGEEALRKLEKGAEPSDYNKKVWLSGAHMNLAQMYKDSDPQKAHKHLNEAKKIINSDERLVLRKKQWNKLAESF